QTNHTGGNCSSIFIHAHSYVHVYLYMRVCGRHLREEDTNLKMGRKQNSRRKTSERALAKEKDDKRTQKKIHQ
ncbi:hypothetical protein, unlikely, partial [Trypanosoma brucei brucei TREU927]